jgi:transposase
MNTLEHLIEPTLEQLPTVWIGLDVSKDTLDACLLRPNDKRLSKQFANDASGHAKLLRWVEQLAPQSRAHFCLEATGSYSNGVALYLAEAEQLVSVVNPARIHFFGKGQGQGNKTDKADATLIALFCRKETPELWRAASPEVRWLVALVRRLHSVGELLVQEKNRLQAPGQPAAVVQSLESSIAFLESETKRLQKQIRDHINQNPDLKRDSKLLQSIPGVGELTAWDILAELPDVSQFDSAQSVAAYAGLAPREHQSGKSVRKQTRLSKQGNTRLRRALYFPAVTALTWNPLVKAHYLRLREAGKGKMVALAACMRKMLMIIYGVLKHQKPFDPAWNSQALANLSS